jgi:cytochrome c biogenesis protein CcmG/thiol:disulfide interchange protein DsbE
LIRSALIVFPLLIVAALVALFASQIGRDPSLVPSALIGHPAPSFDLAPPAGIQVPGFSNADLSGQVSVVNVFASWCVPCRAEHPLLMQLADRGDIALFGINHNDEPANAAAFLDELGNPFARIGSDRDRRVSIDWGVYGVPETFVVDAAGIIRFKHVGPLTPQSLARDLLPAIAAARTTR